MKGKEMSSKISRCKTCSQFFDSKKDLKDHIDKNHRIANSKMAATGITNQAADNNNNNN
jgi:uncharacterized C2H2 Zn-finger protein